MITTILIVIVILVAFRLGIAVGEFHSLGRGTPTPKPAAPTAGGSVSQPHVAVVLGPTAPDIARRRQANLKEVQCRVDALSAEQATRAVLMETAAAEAAEDRLRNPLSDDEVVEAEILTVEEEMALHDLVLVRSQTTPNRVEERE